MPPTHFGRLEVSKWFLRLSFLIIWVSGVVTNDDAYAQQTGKTISGIIRNEKGEPLSGATIAIKGATTATVTNDKGQYTINVPSSNSVLVISYVGMVTQEVKVTAGVPLNLYLTSAGQSLNDVVVVGYGKQKKATLTGSVEQISSKTLENRAVTNVGLALQGETPGLLVTRTSPRPGNEGLDFVIRGLSSVNGSAPLIIVDGVPVLNSYSFLNMNADDIESISVLKDASAAIYGSAAANGKNSLDLYGLTLKDGKLQQLTDNLGEKYAWEVSPDTSQVLYTEGTKNGKHIIHLLDIKTLVDRSLVDDTFISVGGFSWRPIKAK